ncbi:Cupin domain-containing protein [Cohaesibacter sp. ES.047]|uniref:cupin domain-containing protein n=1 Tax=Cohaesibacter sp. ES.047 TaxID=1798205 RepID=UPI000BC08CD4|nr:cupin domain-containing protein [Cohaesibacter sp. ES.047]SNY93135.1 Cupin domain-containing protein [Cohaesibacter sp. ES.047]
MSKSSPLQNAPQSGLLTSSGLAQFSGIDAIILLGGTSAPFTVMDLIIKPGMGAPAHISFHEDKLFHVFNGTLLFLSGEERIQIQPNNHVFIPKGTIHGFKALGDERARMTLVSTPAGHDRFFAAMSELSVPHTPEEVASVCKRHGQAITGPLVS